MLPAPVVPNVEGSQRPSVCYVPRFGSSSGAEAIELAQMAGLDLDPWQEFVLASSLGERDDGKWAAFEVGLVVSRQNGKGSILEARELAGLFLLDERLLIHSAHEFPTSMEAFRRLLELIESTPEFDRRVFRVSRSHGEEGIELKKNPRTGLRQRIRFRTRTKGGGRGFSGDLLVLDEAMILPETAHGALLPTLSARPNPQVWYTGSAVDQAVHEHGVVLSRVRERGIRGDDPSLAYFEWGAEGDLDTFVNDPVAARDERAWAAANPGLGIRISVEHVAREQRAMDPRTFAVERLGVGDWPDTSAAASRVITSEAWADRRDARSQIVGGMRFAFDVTPDRSMSSIGVAGLRADGDLHLEVIDRRPGTGWVADRLADLTGTHESGAVICDGSGPAGSLIPVVEALNVEVHAVTAGEHAQAFGMFIDGVVQQVVWHLGSPSLAAAIAGATTRPLGDAKAWSRKSSDVDISPLVAVTLAGWGVRTMPSNEPWVVMM